MSKALKRPRTIEERLQLLGLPPERDSCVFYKSFLEQLEELQGEEQAALAMAIPRYALRRIKPTFEKGYLRAIWSGIEPQLDANWHKYINALEKEQTFNKPLANNEQTMSKAGGNENDNVNVNVNDNVNDNAQTLASIAGLNVLKEFELGLALLRKGYIVKAKKLHEVYEHSQVKEKVQAAPEKWGFIKCPNNGGAPLANFVEATKCRDTRALEILGATMATENEGQILEIMCTSDAARVIGETGKANAMTYAKTIGANDIKLVYNGGQ